MEEQSEGTEQRRGRSRVRWWLAMLPVAAACAAAVWLSVSRAGPVVSWSAVLEAVWTRETMHGLARVYLRNGEEWGYALWARMEGPSAYQAEGMLMPVTGAAEMPEELDPELVMLCDAMNYCGDRGVVTRLAEQGAREVRARWVKSEEGRRMVVDLDGSAVSGEEEFECPDEWRLYLDPETMLVRRMELFIVEGGERTLRGACDYEYDKPLPSDFGEGPG